MKLITIVIDEKGDSTVDLEGFQGKGCGAIQEAFAKAVGTSTHVEKKREFNAPTIVANRLQQGK